VKFAKETQKKLKQESGIIVKNEDRLVGYKVGDTYNGKPLKKNEVLMAGFIDKLLNKYKDENIFYIEDDVRFNEEKPLTTLKRPFKENDIVWAVYRRGSLDNKPPHNVITGSQAIYFSKKSLKRMRDHVTTKKLQHIDSYFSKFINENKDIKRRFKQMDPNMGYEVEHKSLISKEKDWKKYTRKN